MFCQLCVRQEVKEPSWECGIILDKEMCVHLCVHSKDPKHFLHPLRYSEVCYIFQRKGGQFLVMRRARGEIKNKKPPDFTEGFVASCISHTDCRDLLEKTDSRRQPKRKEQIKIRPQNFQLKEKTEKLSSNSLLQICMESQGVSSAHLVSSE